MLVSGVTEKVFRKKRYFLRRFRAEIRWAMLINETRFKSGNYRVGFDHQYAAISERYAFHRR